MMVVVFEFSTAVFVSHSDIGEAEKVEYNYQNLNSLPPKPEEKISRSTFCKSNFFAKLLACFSFAYGAKN